MESLASFVRIWMQNQYGKKLRGLISKNYHLDTIVRMHGIDAFETEVSAYPSIIRIDKLEGKIKYADCKQSFDSDDALELKICFKAEIVIMWVQISPQ